MAVALTACCCCLFLLLPLALAAALLAVLLPAALLAVVLLGLAVLVLDADALGAGSLGGLLPHRRRLLDHHGLEPGDDRLLLGLLDLVLAVQREVLDVVREGLLDLGVDLAGGVDAGVRDLVVEELDDLVDLLQAGRRAGVEGDGDVRDLDGRRRVPGRDEDVLLAELESAVVVAGHRLLLALRPGVLGREGLEDVVDVVRADAGLAEEHAVLHPLGVAASRLAALREGGELGLVAVLRPRDLVGGLGDRRGGEGRLVLVHGV